MSKWYNDIINNPNDNSKIVDAISYFENQIEEASKTNEMKITGRLQEVIKKLPGITEYRFNQLQELDAILNYLNIKLEQTKSYHYRKYLERYDRTLTSRDSEKFASGEDDVINYQIIINDVALVRNKYLGLMKALEQVSFSTNNIVKLKVAGLDDASVDN